MRLIYLIGILSIALCCCSDKYKFSDDDLQWQPYSGGELLVFQSEKGELDSIFISKEIKSHLGPYGQDWRLFPDKFETLCIGAKHSDPSPPKGTEHRYLDGCILELNSVKKEDELWIQFTLTAKDAWFYHSSRNKSELKNLPKEKLKTPYKLLDDVIVIESNDEEYKERGNFIERIYWSMSEGYVRYDLKKGRYWEIIKKE